MKSKSLNNQERWEEISDFWDTHTQAGNSFHNEIVAPIARKLLKVLNTDHYIDIACSTGLFARELATKAEFVLGVDFSNNFVEKARSRSSTFNNLEFQRVDVTQVEQMIALGQNRFHGAISNMALMDIENIHSFFQGLAIILKPNASFVATLLHPSFHGGDLNFFLESSIQDKQFIIHKGIKVQTYLSETRFEQTGIVGQPIPHFCFHRPLAKLVEPAFKNGFVIELSSI